MPLISVILPVHDGEKTIRETIESVLNQTFSDLEIIVINDGSQDSTLAVVNRIKEPRLKFFSYPQAGVSVARNRGISHASGEYIAFIDADDLWKSDKIAAQLEALRANPKAAVAYSWTDWIDESGKFLRPGGHITANGNVYKQLLIRDFIESGSNPLILKEALSKVGGFDASLAHGEDWEMWLRLAAHYEFVAVPSAHILYRVAGNSASCDIWKMETGSLQVIERAFAQAPELMSDRLKREVLGERYKYLTLKALEKPLERRKGITAVRFLWQAISHDPSWLKKRKLMLIVLLKISMAILLPSQQVHNLLRDIRHLVKKPVTID